MCGISLLMVGSSATLGLAVVFSALAFDRGISPSFFEPYERWWQKKLRMFDVKGIVQRVPRIQILVVAAVLFLGLVTGNELVFSIALIAAAAPPFVLFRRVRSRRNRLEDQVDGMLTALANALGATPNLGDAMASLMDFTEEPMRVELAKVLGEVKLGRTLEEALAVFAKRADVHGIETAITALVTGRRTGGDLPHILRQTAAAIRENARLAGVLKTKTAEGRNQALVMGLVPLILIVALQKIDPGWLAPMWNDPLGWILLGAAALLEIVAIALVKRIMAVDL